MTTPPPHPPATPAAPQVPDDARSRRISVRAAAGLLVAACAVLAAVSAFALAVLFGSGSVAWAAGLAAALGVAFTTLPVVVLAARLAPAPAPSAGAPAEKPIAPTAVPRDQFMDLAGREWARARRYGTGAALLVVEIDRFMRLVESQGTVVTDAMMAELLRQTAPSLRGADVVTRFAESQMAVFLAPSDALGALDVAERIRERAELMDLSSPAGGLHFTVSCGVAQLRPAHLNLQSLLDDAGEAVGAARTAGGNCVRAAPVESTSLYAPGSSWASDNRARPK